MSSLFSCFMRDKPPPTPPLPDSNISIFRSLIESYKSLKSSYPPNSLPPLLLPPSSLVPPSSLLPLSSSLLPHSSSLLNQSSSYFPPSSFPPPAPPSSRKQRKWIPLEDATLKELQLKYKGNWELIGYLLGRTTHQCRHRWKKIGGGRERKKWSEEEDRRVMELYEKYGNNWHKISIEMENRTGKQIRDRYNNVLDPKRKTDDWSKDEDEKLLSLYREVGGKWKFISEKMNGRTENMVKNRWNHYLKFKIEIKQETQYYSSDNSTPISRSISNSSITSSKMQCLMGVLLPSGFLGKREKNSIFLDSESSRINSFGHIEKSIENLSINNTEEEGGGRKGG